MTLEEIKKSIQDIIESKEDDEVAHSKEDDLREKFIKWLSKSDITE